MLLLGSQVSVYISTSRSTSRALVLQRISVNQYRVEMSDNHSTEIMWNGRKWETVGHTNRVTSALGSGSHAQILSIASRAGNEFSSRQGREGGEVPRIGRLAWLSRSSTHGLKIGKDRIHSIGSLQNSPISSWTRRAKSYTNSVRVEEAAENETLKQTIEGDSRQRRSQSVGTRANRGSRTPRSIAQRPTDLISPVWESMYERANHGAFKHLLQPFDRIEVYWDMDDTFYSGTVLERFGNGFIVIYDDEDVEELNIERDMFCFLEQCPRTVQMPSMRRQRRKSRRANYVGRPGSTPCPDVPGFVLRRESNIESLQTKIEAPRVQEETRKTYASPVTERGARIESESSQDNGGTRENSEYGVLEECEQNFGSDYYNEDDYSKAGQEYEAEKPLRDLDLIAAMEQIYLVSPRFGTIPAIPENHAPFVDFLRIGDRIEVYWPTQDKWYAGEVIQLTPGNSDAYVKYYNQQIYPINLNKEIIRFMDMDAKLGEVGDGRPGYTTCPSVPEYVLHRCYKFKISCGEYEATD